MKSIIPINGLPVEFTDEVPTRAGDHYAFDSYLNASKATIDDVAIIRVDEKYGVYVVGQLHHFNYLWSAPLVPVTEVEKVKETIEQAYSEAFQDAGGSEYELQYKWKISNARKVIEGTL